MEEAAQKPDDHLETDQIDSLISAAGVAGAREILNAFWRSTDALLGALIDEVEAGRFEDAAKTAHALKGSAANVGAKRLAETAQMAELACKRDDAECAVAVLSDAREDFSAVKLCFEAHLEKAA